MTKRRRGMPTLKKLELENGVSQQMPMKSRRL
jgi:hypothetical protein